MAGPRTIDVTIRGKNQLGGALKDAKQSILSLINPVNVLKGAFAALGIATLAGVFKKATKAAIEHEQGLGRNIETLDRLKAAWDYVLVSLGRAILGIDHAGGVTETATKALATMGQWIEDNRHVFEGLADVFLAMARSITAVTAAIGKLDLQKFDWGLIGASKEFVRTLSNFGVRDAITGGRGGPTPGPPGFDRFRAEQARIKELEERRKNADKYEKDFGQLEQFRRQGAPSIGLTPGQVGTIPGLRQATLADAQAPAAAVAGAIAEGQADKAVAGLESMRDVIDDLTTNTITNFGETWAEAIGAIVTGSESAGKAILKAFRRATGGSLIAEGQKWILEAGAIAIKGVYNPGELGRAAALFAKGTAAIGLGSAFMGGGGGGGGGLSGSSLGAQQREMNEARGKRTIVIRGGTNLDMRDPTVRQELADALSDLGDLGDLEFEFSRGG